MPPPLWGIEQSSLPGGSPPSLQAFSIEATLISSGPPPLEQKKTHLLRNSFFFMSTWYDKNKIISSQTLNLWLTSGFIFPSFRHTLILVWSHRKWTHTCKESDRGRKMGRKHIKGNLLRCLFSVLWCRRAAMQSPVSCTQTLCKHTCAHTLFLTGNAHTQWQQTTELINFCSSVYPLFLSLTLSLSRSLIHCVHKWFILCVGCLQVTRLMKYPSIWSRCGIFCPFQHLLLVPMFPYGAPADAQAACWIGLRISSSPLAASLCISLSHWENLLIRQDCSNAVNQPLSSCSVAHASS